MEKIEQLFTFIDGEAGRFVESENVTYLDGVLEALNNWISGEKIPEGEWDRNDIRKGIQLALLKGMRESAQVNHQMTPDSLGLIVGYLVDQFFEDTLAENKTITMLDPAIGTGNLLLTVMNLIGDKVTGAGVEMDDLLIQIAAVSADLQQQPVALYHQNALMPLLIDPVDAVVCDVPVGYYPDEEYANKHYEIHAEEGMTYAHHLFIEKAMNQLREGGYGFFLVPSNIFESEQARHLFAYVKANTWIQAVIQLPSNLFKKQQLSKSIFVLQKKGENVKPVKDVLLAKVPTLSNPDALEQFFARVRKWKKEEGK